MPTNFNNKRRIESLEFDRQKVRDSLTALDFQAERLPGKRFTFLAETVEDEEDDPSYPTTGDTFKIRFVDIEWDTVVPGTGLTRKPRSEKWQVIAKSVNGKHITKNTLCFAVFQPPPLGSTDKGKWIIMPLVGVESDFAFFELKERLNCGGTVEAYRMQWDRFLGEWHRGEVIKVKDEYGDLHAEVGYNGWAAKRELWEGAQAEEEDQETIGEDVWSIIYWDHQAIFIEGVLTSNMVEGNYGYEATAAISKYYQGQEPQLVEGQLIVYDSQGLFADFGVGAKFKAVWSQCEKRYIVWTGKHTPTPIVFFELKEDLNCGGTVEANVLKSLSGVYPPGTEILVHDADGDRHCLSGGTGWAALGNPADTAFTIINVQHQAIFIEFELQEPLGVTGIAAATVVDYYQGQAPPDIEQSVSVYDLQSIFPRAMTGASGKAVWNQCAKQYQIWECQQLARTLKATLTAAMCADASSGSISGVTMTDFSPFNQMPDPAPETAPNPFSLAGREQDEIWLEWDQEAGAYVITQVTHHVVKVLTNVRYNDEECKLEGLYKKATIMLCDEEPEWEELIQLNHHTYISDITKTSTESYDSPECGIAVKFADVCGFGEPVISDFYDIITFLQQRVVTDVFYDTQSVFHQVTQVIFVPCTGIETSEEIADLSECCPGNPVEQECCCGLTSEDTLTVAFHGGTGQLACLNGMAFDLTWNPGTSSWKGSFLIYEECVNAPDPPFLYLEVTCSCTDGTNGFTLNVASGAFFSGLYGVGEAGITCDPFEVTGIATMSRITPPYGTDFIYWTITKDSI